MISFVGSTQRANHNNDYLNAPIAGLEPVEQIKLNPRAYGALQVR